MPPNPPAAFGPLPAFGPVPPFTVPPPGPSPPFKISFAGANNARSGATGTSFNAGLPVGWQAGDELLVVGMALSSGQVFSQTGGTGNWEIHQQGSGGGGGYSFLYASLTATAATTQPTFTWQTSAHWAWASIAMRPQAGLVIRVEQWAAGVNTSSAGATSTPPPLTSLNPDDASVVLVTGVSNAATLATSLRYASPAGWLVAANGTIESFPASSKNRIAGISYNQNVNGWDIPGTQTWTDDAGNTFFFSTTQVLLTTALPPQPFRPPYPPLGPVPLPPLASVFGPAVPFWARPPGFTPPPAAAAAVPAPVQRPTLPVRQPGRARLGARAALAAGILATGIGPPAVAAPHQPPAIAHPAPHRAQWRGSGPGTAPNVLQQVKIPGTVFTRPSRRASWRGGAGSAPNAAQQKKIPVTVFARKPHGAVWRGGRGVPPAAAAQPFTPKTVYTRLLHRVLWRGGAGPPPAAAPTLGAAQPFTPATVFRRRVARGSWRGVAGVPPAAVRQPFRPVTVYARAVRRALWRAIAGVPPAGTVPQVPQFTFSAAPTTWWWYALAPQWQMASPAEPWAPAVAASTWQTAQATDRWVMIMPGTAQVSVLSAEYVNVNVAAVLGGVTVNPTGFPVAMAFPPRGTPPSVWNTASWLSGTTGYFAQCLVGPGGVVLATGVYDVWVKVTASPEVPVKPAGTLEVF